MEKINLEVGQGVIFGEDTPLNRKIDVIFYKLDSGINLVELPDKTQYKDFGEGHILYVYVGGETMQGTLSIHFSEGEVNGMYVTLMESSTYKFELMEA